MTQFEDYQEQDPKLREAGLINAIPWLDHLEKTGQADVIRQNLTEQAAGTKDLEAQLEALGVKGHITTSTAPVQFEGEINGHYLYFRARGSHWRCEIAKSEEDVFKSNSSLFVKHGEYGEADDPFAASWMPHTEALQLIIDCVKEFLGQE